MSRVASPGRAAKSTLPLEPPAVEDIAASPDVFRRHLHTWYRKHARDLPWRGVDDPYATWLSEIMLQQTRVATVIDRYREFLLRFPTLPSLAAAEESEVLALWSGLGYYRRARMLHRGAQFVLRELGGKLPRSATELRTLPGVGDYTAAAIASIAFGEPVAVMDGNVERVLLRILGLPEERSGKGRAHLAAVAQSLMPPASKRPQRANPGDHNQAMMELGATICLPKAPLCLQCPVLDFCRTRGEHCTAERAKQQSRIVAHLLRIRKRSTTTEVLLARRPATASLMPGMLELPPLPLDAIADREPVLRLRHSITNTNYYVQVFSESAPGTAPPAEGRYPTPSSSTSQVDDIVVSEEGFAKEADDARDELFVADPADLAAEPQLIEAVPSSVGDLEWLPTSRLPHLPLTGLARKSLQRLGVMKVPKLQVG